MAGERGAIPAGLSTLLQDFTVACLRENPSNYTSFAVQFFSQRNRGIDFGGTEPCWNSNKSSDSKQVLRATEKASVTMLTMPYKDEVTTRNHKSKTCHTIPSSTKPTPKNEQQRQSLIKCLSSFFFFRSFSVEQLKLLADAMVLRKMKVGDILIPRVDDGDIVYIIESGAFDVFMTINGNRWKIGSFRGPFENLAPITNSPRNTTFVAIDASVVWGLERSAIRSVVMMFSKETRKFHRALIDNCSLLKPLTQYEKMTLIDGLKTKSYREGEKIFAQGDVAHCMYFVEDGQVSIRIRQNKEKETEVKKCSRGDYFGELALMTKKPRAASAYCIRWVRLAILDVENFEKLMGPCMNVMKKQASSYPIALEKAVSKADRAPKSSRKI